MARPPLLRKEGNSFVFTRGVRCLRPQGRDHPNHFRSALPTSIACARISVSRASMRSSVRTLVKDFAQTWSASKTAQTSPCSSTRCGNTVWTKRCSFPCKRQNLRGRGDGHPLFLHRRRGPAECEPKLGSGSLLAGCVLLLPSLPRQRSIPSSRKVGSR